MTTPYKMKQLSLHLYILDIKVYKIEAYLRALMILPRLRCVLCACLDSFYENLVGESLKHVCTNLQVTFLSCEDKHRTEGYHIR